MGKNRKPVFKRPCRTAWLALRLLPAEKESVRMAAGARGMHMSEYVLHLHRCALGGEKNVRTAAH